MIAPSIFGCGMVVLREEKREAFALELHPRNLRRRRNRKACRFEHVGTPARARRRTVPVLGDVEPAAREHEPGRGRDVDRLRPVAARAAGIDHEREFVFDMQAARPHRLRRTDHFGGRFPLRR